MPRRKLLYVDSTKPIHEQVSEILAKPKESWTMEESLLVDYAYCLTSNGGAQIEPYQTLPSGHYLHNPAQKTVPSASDMAARLIKNAGERGADWVKGMMNPRRDPVKAALDSTGKYYNNLAKAKASGKWEKNLGKVSHADIVKVVTALGEGVFTEGLAARKDKINSAFSELQPKLQAVSNTIQALPSASDGDNEQRMLQNLKLMRAIGSK